MPDAKPSKADPAPRPDTTPRRLVRCPACGGDSLFDASNRFRPFCSERCKALDLGAWASESFSVPAEAPPEDQTYGDPRLQ